MKGIYSNMPCKLAFLHRNEAKEETPNLPSNLPVILWGNTDKFSTILSADVLNNVANITELIVLLKSL